MRTPSLIVRRLSRWGCSLAADEDQIQAHGAMMAVIEHDFLAPCQKLGRNHCAVIDKGTKNLSARVELCEDTRANQHRGFGPVCAELKGFRV